MGDSGGRENGFAIVVLGLAVGCVVGAIALGPIGFFIGGAVGTFIGLVLSEGNMEEENEVSSVNWFGCLLILLFALALFVCLGLGTMAGPATLDSPLPTPHPPCPPDYAPEACEAAWASLPGCNYTACPLGCVSNIYCVVCEGLNCWANPTPWYTNTLNIPVPQGPVARTWRVFIPTILK